MATVTGVTAERADEIEDASVVGASIQGSDLVLVTHGGTQINVGRVIPQKYLAYPVGSIYMTDQAANPATYMEGGTWVRWGKGRVPVSVDEVQVEFDTVEKTNSATTKTHTLSVPEMPSHIHTASSGTQSANHTHGEARPNAGISGTAVGGGTPGFLMDNIVVVQSGIESGPHTHAITVAAAGGNIAHNNLQPYITCYMWKRTA